MNLSLPPFVKFILTVLRELLNLLFLPLRWVWQQLSPLWRNVTVGVLIALLLTTTHYHPLLIEIENSGIDWVMSLYRGTTPPKYARHFVVIDIDEQTYRRWGMPLLTPRDKLLKLLQKAVAGQPRVILVDIELSQTGQHPSQNQALHDYLASYCQPPMQSPCPHIIFARKLSKITSLSTGNRLSPYLAQNETFIDDVVNHSPFLHWASTLFETNPTYGNLRHWRLWEATCKPLTVDDNSQTPASLLQPDEVIPSMQLLGSVLSKDPLEEEKLRKALSQFRPTDCTQPPVTPSLPAEETKFQLDGFSLTLTPTQLNRRVIYTLPWDLDDGEKWPLTEAEKQPLLTRFSASHLTEGPFDSGYLRTVLKNSITVIGGSYADSRDLHATPLGQMPGYLVVINALHSLIQFGELTPISSWVQYLLIELPLIFLISWIFALPRFNSLTAMLSVLGLMILCLLPISILVFRYGIWLNFIVPLLGVFGHQFFAYLEER